MIEVLNAFGLLLIFGGVIVYMAYKFIATVYFKK